MNGPIHCCTGYLAARALGYREYRFEALFISLGAYSPDFDIPLRRLFPGIEHGVWTHTIIGAILTACLFAGIVYILLCRFYSAASVSCIRLLGLATFGAGTHLFLDAFTFYYSVSDATHHRYFWPVWYFPWHINTMFPGVSFRIRVWVEVIYSFVVAGYILMYQWGFRGENPFRALFPEKWFEPNP